MEQNACEWPGHGDSAGSRLASTLGLSIVETLHQTQSFRPILPNFR
jgi:hypothetical protein